MDLKAKPTVTQSRPQYIRKVVGQVQPNMHASYNDVSGEATLARVRNASPAAPCPPSPHCSVLKVPSNEVTIPRYEAASDNRVRVQARGEAIPKTMPSDQPFTNRPAVKQIQKQRVQQCSPQNTVPYANANNGQRNDAVRDSTFDNGPVKFTITVDGQEFAIEMDSADGVEADLECQMCKELFGTSGERLQHEIAKHAGQKRAEIVVFNPMEFHAHQAKPFKYD